MNARPRWLRIPSPDERVDIWHVAPLIDSLGYAFSWLWILVPLAFAGQQHPTDYLTLWIVGNVLSFSHRHVTLPYVYLDRQVYSSHKARFTAIPLLLFLAFLVSGLLRDWIVPVGFYGAPDVLLALGGLLVGAQWWWSDRKGQALSARALTLWVAPAVLAVCLGLLRPYGADHAWTSAFWLAALTGSSAALALEAPPGRRRWAMPALIGGLAVIAACFALTGDGAALYPLQRMRFKVLIGLVASFAGAWNIWHVYQQKYGILRLYNAKGGGRVPGWVDRFLVFGWVPSYLFALAPVALPLLRTHARGTGGWLEPLVQVLGAWRGIGLPLTLAVGLASVACFFWAEWRHNRLHNPARLVMGIGTIGLAMSFFFVDPFKVYVAFGFSHAVEYVIFVWAFQRRRYHAPLAHDPLMGRLLRSPLLWWASFFVVVGGLYALSEYGPGRLYDRSPQILGTRLKSWIFYWTVYQSLAHFYFDSFLWKMRLPEVRASL